MTLIRSTGRFVALATVNAFFAFWAAPVATAEPVRVVIANAEELIASIPDADLAEDVLSTISDELWHENVHGSIDHVDAAERATLLVILAAPNDVRSAHRSGVSIYIDPVDDFAAFVDAIDYGEVVEQNAARRVVRVNIDAEQISDENLVARSESASTNISLMAQSTIRRLAPSNDGRSRDPFARNAFGNAGNDREETLGDTFNEGDRIEIDLAGVPCVGTVLDASLGSKGDEYEIRVEPVDELAKAIRDRGLKNRLLRAGSMTLIATKARLRRARTVSPGNGPRTWTDKSGRFRVEATFGGVEDGRVRLKKTGGKEILVPISRLAAADQELIAKLVETSDPFADQPAADGAPGSLRADWGDATAIAIKNYSRWTFDPPSGGPRRPATRKTDSLPVGLSGPDEEWAPRIDRLFVSGDGAAAIVSRDGVGFDGGYVQALDFARGTTGDSIQLPARSELLDASPTDRLIVLKSEAHGVGRQDRVYIHRLIDGGTEPYSDWMSASDKAFHKGLNAAFLLSGGRVMTRGFHTPWVVWDIDSAKALYYLPPSFSGFHVASVDPSRRFAFFGGDRAVLIVDTSTGEHVATIAHTLKLLAGICVDETVSRVALWSNGEVAACDLATGESLFSVSGAVRADAEVEWMDDFLLLRNRYVLEPNYPVLLWRYQVYPAARDQLLMVRGGRLWYAPSSIDSRNTGTASLYVASIEAPNKKLTDVRSSLPEAEDLVILGPGDRVRVSIDTTLGPGEEARILEAVSDSLTRSGFRVVNEIEATDDTLNAVVVCKPSGERRVQIVVHDPKKPVILGNPSNRATPVTLTPFESHVSIRRGDDELWSDVRRVNPGQVVYGMPNESADDIIDRVTSPNVDRLLKIDFPTQICRRGDATPDGLYGFTLLTPDGPQEGPE